MDWLQFVASVTSSLAWPAVVALLLFLLRAQLASLAQRLTELSLPGGAKASFRDLILDVKTSAAAIATDRNKEKNTDDNEQKALTPKQKISSTFEGLEAEIANIIASLPIQERKTPADFIFYTLWPHGDGETLYRLYDDLRQIVLTSGQAPSITVSDKDAEDFEFACEVVLRKFKQEFEDWKAQGARQKKTPETEASGH